MNDKPSLSLVEDTEEMIEWRAFEPGSNGPLLEKFGRKNGGEVQG